MITQREASNREILSRSLGGKFSWRGGFAENPGAKLWRTPTAGSEIEKKHRFI
jgi:hypothetical protein